MNVTIANNSTVPLYQQIEDQVKAAILKEELRAGDPLPSIRQFANDLQVSVLTIRRVYSDLEAEGFVVSQAGLGTFVAESNLDLLLDAKRRAVEKKMVDLIKVAKSVKVTKKELLEMMQILYEEER
ncbi:MAG: GntR family transcriptional regulator [Coriobacteriaceae bacterium]|uniref:GntR family transcriptional regulator n=1 Tax=Tractidigestivibacter sp. TaxID=2847320 RepID=UPI002A910CF9|nr:GntR family transcriptional regulator [Tractidigestivibacter sp.]MCI6273657.1 GntR family transcriptional regulator [Coriobacteriaceae bacterium]MCI6548482.1 GntR family transcriptional regulator [Coriobacteriaceae bacterium]MDY5271805.1 GntR family transcriptional regulator [Tractidigestivibacter sp.]